MNKTAMGKISAALDSPIGRLVDNASPKIGAVTTVVAGTSWYMAIPWDNVVLITSNNFIKRKELASGSDDN